MDEIKQEPDQSLTTSTPAIPVRQRSWVRVLLMLVIFASGAIVGTCSTLVIIRQQVLQRIHHPEEMPFNVASRLTRLLDLDEKQSKQVQKILSDRQQSIQQLRREYQPQLEQELNQIEEEIATVLDDQQRVSWRDEFQDFRATWLPTASQQ